MPTPIRIGTEFLVNTTTTGRQQGSAITSLSDGRFVVTWMDNSQTGGDTSSWAIRAQAFNANGSPSGAEFLVNTRTIDGQVDPSITSLTEGRFAVTWADGSLASNPNGHFAIRAQMFNGNGSQSGTEFQVNTTLADGAEPAITSLPDGRFVVTWSEYRPLGDCGIRMQVFDANGSPSGTHALINATPQYASDTSAIAALNDGRFVVTYGETFQPAESAEDDSFYAVRAQMFNSDGTSATPEFLVNTTTQGQQGWPSITVLSNDRFVVTWSDFSQTGNDIWGAAVRAQIFNANGSRAGAEFLINTTTEGEQQGPKIAALSGGRFVVTWNDSSGTGGDASGFAVYAQVFDGDGSRAGAEFLVNTATGGHQIAPDVTALDNGRFVVTWSDFSQTGDDTSSGAIRAQIFDAGDAVSAGPWDFSYGTASTVPTDMLTFAHLATDSYNDDKPGLEVGEIIRPPAGWTAILTTKDGDVPAPKVDSLANAIATITFTAAPGMQATAYREDATGRVVIAYRGTDGGNAELVSASISLGLGLITSTTTSYLQSAVDFYAELVNGSPAVSPDMIAFTGHSLGGMLAGFMAGQTGAQGMIFDSGPHSEIVQFLGTGINWHGLDHLAGTPDYAGLVHTRIDGEILGVGVSVLKAAAWVALFVSIGMADTAATELVLGLIARSGDATVEGSGLDDLISGLSPFSYDISDLALLHYNKDQHSMPLLLMTLYAQQELRLTNYKEVQGFLLSFFNDDLAVSASKVFENAEFTTVLAADLFREMVLAVHDRVGGLEDVLTPLLQSAEANLVDIALSSVGLGTDPTIYSRNFQFDSNIINYLSQHYVETAARALFSSPSSGDVSFATALGETRVGAEGEWISLTPYVFRGQDQTDSPTVGLNAIAASLADAMGLKEDQLAAVNQAQRIFVLADPDHGRSLIGTAGNDLIIGASDASKLGVTLDGEAGNDVIVGTGWDDLLTGGSGVNYLLGGQGNDRYVASAALGANTTVSDLGGNDRLDVGGQILNQFGTAYFGNALTLTVGSQGATVRILDHYLTGVLGGVGFGHIESIVNSDGTIWRPTTITQRAFGVLEHGINSVAAGLTALVSAAIDAADNVIGTLGDFGARSVQVFGAGVEDTFRFVETQFDAASVYLRGLLPSGRFAASANVAAPSTYHIIDIDANRDGIVDASITLAGSYAGLGLSVVRDGADTVIRLTLDPTVQFDITGRNTAKDRLSGTAVAERIGGLGGNDSLFGLTGDDTLLGGAGKDWLDGGQGIDQMFGGTGNDYYVVDHVGDMVIEFFGEGNDTVSASVDYTLLTPIENLLLSGTDSLAGTGNSLSNRLTGNAGANSLSGLEGQDTLVGLNGADVLDGGKGNDSISGGDGDDTLIGGTGNDLLAGGVGNDLYFLDSATDVIVEIKGQGTADRAATSVSFALAADDNIEFLQTTSGEGTGAINLKGNALTQTIIGNAGINTLEDGMGAADVLTGLDGDDTYIIRTVATTIVETAGQGTADKVLASVSFVLAADDDIEFLQTISAVGTGAINLRGNALAQTIIGNAGINRLEDGVGAADVLTGLGGNDTYIIRTAATTIVEAAGQGNADKVLASVSFGLAANDNIELLQTTSAAGTVAINLTGNALAQQIIGNAGINTLEDGAGAADVLTGLGGNDTFIIRTAATTIVEAAGQGIADAVLASISFVLAADDNIEFLQTTSFSETAAINLTGNALAQQIIGNAGANRLDGKGGNDVLTGGLGADVFVFTTTLGAGNVDRIVDYDEVTDQIEIENAVFTGMLDTNGPLTEAAYTVNTTGTATLSSHRIIYETDTGYLWFDRDGYGGVTAKHFATVAIGTVLSAGEFTVI